MRASTFGRVTAVESETTLIVSIGDAAQQIRVAHVEPFDAAHDWNERLRLRVARQLIGKWVMLEPAGEAWLVYRSPDGLFVNEWLVSAGIARAGCSCARLQHLERKARVTGQGFWVTGSVIHGEQIATAEILGRLDPAGKRSGQSSPAPQPPRRRGRRK